VAFVLAADAPAGPVQAAIEEAAGPLLGSCLLFDVFEGGALPPGRKSLAFSLDLRAPDRTLASEEADAAVAAIAERLARDFGAELRAG
jgi:phenylalanyl-tRNA synthetase beta chain